MQENIDKVSLHLLDYTEDWIKAGILDISDLEEQIKESQLGEDLNKEHYRYKTLTTYLSIQNSLTDDQVENIISLLGNDADRAMVNSAFVYLLKQSYLTDIQYEIVSQTCLAINSRAEKYINQQKDIRMMSKIEAHKNFL